MNFYFDNKSRGTNTDKNEQAKGWRATYDSSYFLPIKARHCRRSRLV